MPLNTEESERKVNLDEIEPDSAGAGETGDQEPPECEDSPTGQHEYDRPDDSEVDTCVYCGEEKD